MMMTHMLLSLLYIILTRSNANNYSFKIYIRFWLAKITWIILHNQLLLTKFRRFLPHWIYDVKSATKLQIIEQLTEKTWDEFELFSKWVINGGTSYSFHGELLSKNIARTAKTQLDGRHLLFGEYLQTWTALYFLTFPLKDALSTWTEVRMF